MNPTQSGYGYSGNKIPSGYSYGQIQKYTPAQMKLHESLFPYVGDQSFLAKLAGGDQAAFDEMERPALRQFNELQGGLASRFSGMGQGGRRSSGFKNASSAAASNFAEKLQSQRLNIRRQALSDLFGMSNQLLNQNPYEQFMIEKQQDQGWAPIVGAGIGAAGGFFLGGPAGALTGAQLGYGMGGGTNANVARVNTSGFKSPEGWDPAYSVANYFDPRI